MCHKRDFRSKLAQEATAAALKGPRDPDGVRDSYTNISSQRTNQRDLGRDRRAGLAGDFSTPHPITNNACVPKANMETADLNNTVNHVV